MKKTTKIHLLVIDPQNDFMDQSGAALPVTGATLDMQRLALFIRTFGDRLADIHVTLDSHQIVAIFHPAWWRNSKGESPAPYTIITSDDIEASIWTTRDPNMRKRSLEYVKALEATGKNYMLMIWPPHCLIGTLGHAVQKDLMDALVEWQTKEFATVDFVTKGTNPYTEHYGGLMAEVADPTDQHTLLNSRLLETLQEADIILIAGEALSHCVKETLNQILDNIGAEHLKKIQILTDCTSPVPKVGNGPDFPAISKLWVAEVQKKGVQLTSSTTFFN
jgi:nicotinamidase/pyrazinamidase